MLTYEDSSSLSNDVPRPKAWTLEYREGTYPAGTIWNGKLLSEVDRFSDLDGEPWEAPRRLAVFCTWTDEFDNRQEVFNEEFFLYLRTTGTSPIATTGSWIGANQAGVDERRRDGESFVQVFGKWVPTAEFNRIERNARFDKRFPAWRGDREAVLSELRIAAAYTGHNKIKVYQSAIFIARNLGYPYESFIAPEIEEELYKSLREKYQQR